MAFLTYHFAPSGLGAANGSSAANAAPLFPSGNLHSLLLNNNYANSGVVALCQNTSTYSLSQTLATGIFPSGAPTNSTYSLSLIGCDSSGVPVNPIDYGWRCEESDLDTSGFANLDFTLTTTQMVSAINIRMMFFSVTATSNTSIFSTPLGKISWCNFDFTSTGVSTLGFLMTTTSEGMANCQISMAGTSYARILTKTSYGNQLCNVRIKGDPSASSGTRYGLAMALATAYPISTGRVFVCDVTGIGIINYHSGVNGGLILSDATVVNCGTGVSNIGTTNARLILSNVVITGCTIGVDQSSGLYIFDNVVLRNTTDFDTPAELPTFEPCVFITTETDSQLYANHTIGDYRIKSTSSHWGKNRGAGDEISNGGVELGISIGRQLAKVIG